MSKVNSNIQNASKYGIPPLIHFGQVQSDKGERAIYYITARYAITLEDYISKNPKLDGSQVFEIMIQLFKLFQLVHNMRFTYNDLKPENVMLNNDSKGRV